MPELLIAGVTTSLILGAIALVGPLFILPCLVGVPILWAGTRWYLKDSFSGTAAKVALKKQTPGRAVVGDWDNRP